MKISTPLTREIVSGLHAGDRVSISGRVLGARDAAHKKLAELLASGKGLPCELHGQVIYYVGPTPPRPGQAIGSAGPTTSSRMDEYTPALLEAGLRGTLGKGQRSERVVQACVKYQAVYFAAIGGIGAFLSRRITSARVIAYKELGTEALWEFQFDDFPAIVINDIYGEDWYRSQAGTGKDAAGTRQRRDSQ